MPVMWPVGFTGVHVGGEVEVLDAAGKVVATTGREYYISRGHVESPESARPGGDASARFPPPRTALIHGTLSK